jgi:hypothetical protein
MRDRAARPKAAYACQDEAGVWFARGPVTAKRAERNHWINVAGRKQLHTLMPCHGDVCCSGGPIVKAFCMRMNARAIYIILCNMLSWHIGERATADQAHGMHESTEYEA